jgi:hypothetical protein
MMSFIELGPAGDRLGLQRRATRAGVDLVTIHRLRPMGEGEWLRVYSLSLSPGEGLQLADLLRELAAGEQTTNGGTHEQ